MTLGMIFPTVCGRVTPYAIRGGASSEFGKWSVVRDAGSAAWVGDPPCKVTSIAARNEASFTAAVRDFVADGSGLPHQSAGYAMLFNIQHIEDPVHLRREACRVLVNRALT